MGLLNMKTTDTSSTAFNRLLVQPDSISQKEYEKWIELYPYCQALRKVASLNQKLIDPKGKAYYPGTFLHVIPPHIPADAQQIFQEIEWNHSSTSALINTRFPETSNTKEEEKISLYHDDHLPYSFLWWLNKTRKEYEHTYRPFVKNDTLPLGDKLFIDQQIKEHILKNEPHLNDLDSKGNNQRQKENPDDIIEKFIQEDPKISPPSAEKIDLENKARKSSEDSLVIVSETLAKIYTEQGLYLKAIETYKKLSLKYPEKNVYFAKQIENLSNKIQ